ncbi:MAG TPA: rod shape-determining protein MreC [Terriglobales bacterium]|jgi:rod shape-determining protein MreC
MENLLTRYRNASILVGVLFAQVLGLAVQVRRGTENESSRLIRIWAVSAIAPLEKGIVWLQGGTGGIWHNYIYLRGVRQENRDLKKEIEHLRLERVRLGEDAEQARRLQALLQFKEQFITKTVACQVIGSSGSEQSRSVYIDKGSDDGIAPDMAVITAEGVVGKVLRVFGSTSQVLLINDQSSGVGAILEKSRLQGVLHGTGTGEVVLDRVMSDDTIESGEILRTSGGDQIFPKGLPLGTVKSVSHSPDGFIVINVKPSVSLSKLEEVLVITQKEQRVPAVADSHPVRAADLLARRLPSVPDKPPEPSKPAGEATKTATAGGDSSRPRPPASPAVKPQADTAQVPGPSGEVRPPAAPSKPQSLVNTSQETGSRPVSSPKQNSVPPPSSTPAQDKPE